MLICIVFEISRVWIHAYVFVFGRNVHVNRSKKGSERTWIEITPPMMRSYVHWKIGAVNLEGFDAFLGDASSHGSCV